MPNSGSNEKAPRLTSTIMMALIGAGLFLTFFSRDFPDGLQDDWVRENLGLVARYVIAMMLGGAVMGYLLASMFGRPGLGGWIWAVTGGLLAALVTGACGSLIGLLPDLLADGWQAQDLVSVLFGFLVLPIAAAEKFGSFLIWVIAIAVTHLLSRFERARSGYHK
ncbi:hypothetical protein [Ruegeria arenilitoris]|uniref:hypothetical protein n=1 Tax=Ruegeria arenilitoris TaxID=1173585 RepID=UPI00147D32E9|nr:hypothetical protein [Ruegeria arenilitoris]